MPTKAELMAQGMHEMEQATIPPAEWCRRIQQGYNGKPYNYKDTHNYKAQELLFKAANTQSDYKPPAINLLPVQRCLFLTGDTGRALETKGRLLIATADLAYRRYYSDSFLDEAKKQDRLRVWCDCHATMPETAFTWMSELGLPKHYFYGECESSNAFRVAYDAGARMMVGNMSVLTSNPTVPPNSFTGQLELVDSGTVLVTNETYFNVNRNYGVNWRNADGVGSNCVAVYESRSEGAVYYSLREQESDGKYIVARDCVYVAGFSPDDWEFLVQH